MLTSETELVLDKALFERVIDRLIAMAQAPPFQTDK